MVETCKAQKNCKCMKAMYERIEDVNRIINLLEGVSDKTNAHAIADIIKEPYHALKITMRDCGVMLGNAEEIAHDMITALEQMPKGTIPKPQDWYKLINYAKEWKKELKECADVG